MGNKVRLLEGGPVNVPGLWKHWLGSQGSRWALLVDVEVLESCWQTYGTHSVGGVSTLDE